jgi:galactose mutarotase-like enzyme
MIEAKGANNMADFMNFPTARERVLRVGDTTIGVIPDICLVSHFQVGAWQVLYRPMATGNVKRWGLPLMIPNFSRLKNGIFQEKHTTLPIHGFGRVLPWIVTEQDASSLRMELRSSDATRPSYPYEFTFSSTITAGEGTLAYVVGMENRGQEAMPIAPGFHPYFQVAQQDKPRLLVEGLAGLDAADIDWDTKPPDTPYPFPHRVTVHFPGRGTLTIEEEPLDGAYSLANMQVWSEQASAPDHDFVCFEPTVSSEDALNRPQDRLTVAPGETRRISLLFKIAAE